MFFDNDIAVLKINETALVGQSNIGLLQTFSDSVIDERARKEKSMECWVTGWGYMTDSKGMRILILRDLPAYVWCTKWVKSNGTVRTLSFYRSNGKI